MKRFAPFLVLVSILPTFAFGADLVKVTSGEHVGYTRLVLTISSDVDWRLDTGQNTAKLMFPLQNLEFEDNRVFTRIAKNRLLSISSNQFESTTEYIMNLACECEVTAFSYLNEYIVVDISDRIDAAQMSPITRRTAPSLPFAPVQEIMFRQPLSISWAPPVAPIYYQSPHLVNFPSQAGDAQLSGFALPQEPDASPKTVSVESQNPSDETLQDAINTARASLLHQLTLAADQGLVSLNAPFNVDQDAEKTEPEITPTELSIDINPDKPNKPENDNQISIQSIYTRNAIATVKGANLNDHQCPSHKNLDVASWGNGEDFVAEISNARKHLLREFDEPDPNEKLRLIRTYIRYGFGVEALSHLTNVNPNLKNQVLLRDLAAVVDGRRVQFDGPLSNARGCGGSAGMWSIVGAYPNVEAKMGETESIVEAFAALPPDLRRLLGPRLVSAFVERGFEETGRQIADILDRAPGDSGSEHALIVGHLMQIEGNGPDVSKSYKILIAKNSVVATDALIALATFELSQIKPPSTNLLIDLETAAIAWRGTHKGRIIRRLEALWLAQTGNEIQAIRLLVSEMQNDPMNIEALQRAAEEILSKLSQNTKFDSNFVELVNIYAEYLPEEASADSLRRTIATKLMNSGLPDYALEILRPSMQRENLDSIILAAKANLAAFRPIVALALLDNEKSDAAIQIRIEAYLALGNFVSALSELNQTASGMKVIVLPHWFAGDWVAASITDEAAAEIGRRYKFKVIEQTNSASYAGINQSNGNDAGGVTLSAIREMLTDSTSLTHNLEGIFSNR